MAPSNMGAMILAFTDHTVVAANYHRNVNGLMASFNFYSAQSSIKAHAVMLDRNVTYLLVCNAEGPYGIPLRQRAGSMAEALANGALPQWLTLLSTEDGLEVYQVTP